MQTATFESTYPIMNKIMWGRNYEAMLSTPLEHPQHRARRAGLDRRSASAHWRAVFLLVLFLFGIPRTPLAILAIPVAMLIGVAFAACLIAFTATQKNDVGFSAIFRFVINPLFLFSGTFFPLTNLPEPLACGGVGHAALPRRRADPRLDPGPAGSGRPRRSTSRTCWSCSGSAPFFAERLLTRRMAG